MRETRAARRARQAQLDSMMEMSAVATDYIPQNGQTAPRRRPRRPTTPQPPLKPDAPHWSTTHHQVIDLSEEEHRNEPIDNPDLEFQTHIRNMTPPWLRPSTNTGM